jgi:hypothetical protein
MALPFTLKIILRQKKNYGDSKISPSIQKYNLKKIKNPLKKKPKSFKILKLCKQSQVSTQAKILLFFKNAHIKKETYFLLLLPRGPKSLKLLYSIMNLNTISVK